MTSVKGTSFIELQTMKIFVGQIYIEVGINYPFSHIFQGWISEQLSSLVTSSQKFDEKYPDFNLVFNLSAKAELTSPLIKGPTVFRKTKDVEYSIFLPYFEHDWSDPRTLRKPLRSFLDAAATLLQSLGADVSELQARSESLIDHILADPEMIRKPRDA